MRKAFTLIELLVVIAIIAILAAILFPVFAQAKEAAKKTVSISNMKQVATAFAIYSGDADDNLPFSLIKNAGGNWVPNVIADVPADWRTPTQFLERHGVFWANSTAPYQKSFDLLELQGAETIAANATILKKPAVTGLTMNGLLHTYNASAIAEISRLPMLWYGSGKLNYTGYGRSMPQIRCTTTDAVCRFNPTGMPDSGVHTNGSAWYTPTGGQRSSWVFSRGMIFARADTSAKFRRVGSEGPGTVENVEDPFYGYLANGVGLNYSTCRPLGSAATVGYWCQFRPDFDFNFANWE
jgi:prepilin-type N-terminal cleavage/methylation domain-containing protein